MPTSDAQADALGAGSLQGWSITNHNGTVITAAAENWLYAIRNGATPVTRRPYELANPYEAAAQGRPPGLVDLGQAVRPDQSRQQLPTDHKRRQPGATPLSARSCDKAGDQKRENGNRCGQNSAVPDEIRVSPHAIRKNGTTLFSTPRTANFGQSVAGMRRLSARNRSSIASADPARMIRPTTVVRGSSVDKSL